MATRIVSGLASRRVACLGERVGSMVLCAALGRLQFGPDCSSADLARRVDTQSRGGRSPTGEDPPDRRRKDSQDDDLGASPAVAQAATPTRLGAAREPAAAGVRPIACALAGLGQADERAIAAMFSS